LSTDYQFYELPELNDQHSEFINDCKALFTGDPKKVLVDVEKKDGISIELLE